MGTDGKHVTVLGATGYTGRLIAHELRKHDVPLLLAARSPEKVRRLADQVGGAETAVTDVADRGSLDDLAGRSRVLINCVGPFVDYGEPVVRAAIAAGAHYLDTTGEQPFVKALLIHDTWAKSQGVAVVPASAFEIAVADCAAAVAAVGFTDVEEVDVTYNVHFHASQGTQRTGLRMLQSAGYTYAGGKWIEETPGHHMRFVDFPQPVGRATAISFPSAEIITIPRHVKTQRVQTFMSVPRVGARVISAIAPALPAIARSPIGSLIGRWLGHGTEGPDETARQDSAFHVLVEVRGLREGKATQKRLLVRGHDPYGLTAAIARQAALLMMDRRFDRGGVLTPAQAFDPRKFLDGLHEQGLTYGQFDG